MIFEIPKFILVSVLSEDLPVSVHLCKTFWNTQLAQN